MARRVRPTPPGPDLRGLLADKFRQKAARRPEQTPTGRDDGSFFLSPWPRLVARLEAGEPVELGGWQLLKLCPEVNPSLRYRVEPDGSVTHLPRTA